MSLKRIFSPNVLSVLIIGGFLGALFVLPKILRQKNYQLTSELAKDAEPTVALPMTKKLNRLVAGKNGTVTPLPAVSLQDLIVGDNGTLVVNFWATWCAPCIEELPSLEYLSRQLEGKKDSNRPRVVAISVDESSRDIANLFRTLDYVPSMIILHDADSAFANGVGTTKFPETFLVDRRGTVTQKWLGPQEWLSANILHQLARLPSSP